MRKIYPENTENKALSLCGLCLKSGRLALGESAVRKAVLTEKAFLVVFASDCGENTRKKLEALGVKNLRLVINRFDKKMFKKLGFYKDLDAVIDAAQTQLIALVPFSVDISVIMQRGAAGLEKSPALEVFDRLANRLEGKRVPLLFG